MERLSRLPNGLTVATARMPHLASVSVGLWAAVGGRYEPAELNGATHFIEHMLFKGTRRRSARAISEAVEGLGGYLNAFTGEESTCVHARAHHRHFAAVLDVLMDMFLHPVFDPGEIEKEREVIKEELAMYLDQPHQHVEELLNEILWPDHPLGRSLTGSFQTIAALTREQMLAFRRRHYVAPACLVTVAGPLPHAAVVRAVSRHARHFPGGPRPGFAPVDPARRGPPTKLFTKQTSQTQMALGILVCSRHDPRRHALRVLNALLGESMSSRLFQVLREDTGLAYSVHSSLSLLDDTGLLEIAVGLDTDKLREALGLIRRELRRLTDKPPGRAECRQARDYLIGQLDLGLEGTENRMMWLGDQFLAYGRLRPAAAAQRAVRQVTPDQVRAVARDFFRPERMHLALVSPLRRDPGLMRWLVG